MPVDLHELPGKCPSLAAFAQVQLFLAPKVNLTWQSNFNFADFLVLSKKICFSLADFVFVPYLCTVDKLLSLMAALVENLIFVVDHLVVSVEGCETKRESL